MGGGGRRRKRSTFGVLLICICLHRFGEDRVSGEEEGRSGDEMESHMGLNQNLGEGTGFWSGRLKFWLWGGL